MEHTEIMPQEIKWHTAFLAFSAPHSGAFEAAGVDEVDGPPHRDGWARSERSGMERTREETWHEGSSGPART